MNRPTPTKRGELESAKLGQKKRPTTAAGMPSNIDFVKLAWSAKWLLLLGLLLGLGAGYFQFLQTKPLFRSSARVQIIDSLSKHLPVDGFDMNAQARNLSDEALVMRSEQLLQRAATIGRLNQTREYAGLSPEQIGNYLNGGSLKIGPVANSSNTNVFEVQFESTNAVTSQRVVQSVVDAYAMHLQEQYRNIGQETIDLIQSARQEVLKKLSKLEDDFSNFKRESGLIFRNGEISSLHRDNADNFLAQRQSLVLQKIQFEGMLSSAKNALKAGRPVESVLMALRNGASTDTGNPKKLLVESDESRAVNQRIQRITVAREIAVSEQLRKEKLVPLEMERQVLVGTVGPGHSALKSIDERIDVLKESISAIENTERNYQEQLEEAWDEAERLASENKSEQGETPEDVLRNQLRFAVLSIRQKFESVDQELATISKAYEEEVRAAKQESAAEIQTAQYMREIDRQQQLYNRIVARLDEVNLMSGGDGLKVFPLNTAKPGYQFAPSRAKSLLMGGFLGTMLMFGLALLRKVTDRSYLSAAEIAEHTGLPVIGHVPLLKRYRPEPGEPGAEMDSRLVCFFNQKGSNSEAFRAIRTALYFSNQAGENQIIQVTSATPGDGKSTISANLAITIAQTGKKVLLLDADLRRPRVGRVMGVESEKGVAWAIEQIAIATAEGQSQVSFQDAIIKSEVKNLSLMTAGDRPENPSELLSSSAFETLLMRLRSQFDTIIVDTPPMLAVSDPSNVVSRADGVIMVVRLRKNVKPLVAQASRMLETLEANVLGIVVNGVGSRGAGSYGKTSKAEGYYNNGQHYQYGYGYSYGYNSDSQYSEYYDEDRPKKKVHKTIENAREMT